MGFGKEDEITYTSGDPLIIIGLNGSVIVQGDWDSVELIRSYQKGFHKIRKNKKLRRNHHVKPGSE